MSEFYSNSALYGDVTTWLGFVGLFSTLLIVVTVFRSFYKSPLNK